MRGDAPGGTLKSPRTGSGLSNRQRDTLALVLMLLPCVVVLGIIVVVPLFRLVETSFYMWKLSSPLPKMFYGWGNYAKMLGDKFFWNALRVTLYFIGGAVGIEFVLGLLIAWMVYELMKRQVLTTFLLFPMVIPPIVVALMWRLMFSPSLGMLNYFLGFVGLDYAFLGDPNTALLALIAVDVWEWTPFVILLMSAGFATMPPELREVSLIDGASRWQALIHVALPLLRPLIIITLLLRMVEVVKVFPTIYIMTEGGPGVHTQTLNFLIYRQGVNYTKMGYSSALGVVFFLIVICMAGGIFYLVKKGGLFE